MSTATLDRIERLKTQIHSQSEFIETALTRAADEDRDLNDVELSNVDDAKGNVTRMAEELGRLVQFHDSVAGAEALSPIRTQPRSEPRAAAAGRGQSIEESIGARFADCGELRGFRAGTSGVYSVDDVVPTEFALGNQARATLTSGNAPWPDVIAKSGVVSANQMDKPRPLLEVISRAPTSLAAVPVLRVNSDESGAAVVAEGAQKPEVTWTETIESIPVPTIAGWRKASRQILDDAAMVRNLIDTKLTRSVNNALETSVRTAINTALGVGNTTTGASEVPLLNVIRQAIGALEGRGHTPNAVMLNPADWAALDLTVLGQTLLGPAMGSTFWGLRAVSNPNQVAGTAVVGDFAEGVTLFERTGMSLYVTDSDISGAGATSASDFRANILTFLAEIRAVPVVLDASALQKAVFTA